MRPRVLSVLHSLVALNAVGGGIYGLTGAAGVPVEWLEKTPFSIYLIPSLILLLVVGGTQIAAGLTVSARTPHSRPPTHLCAASRKKSASRQVVLQSQRPARPPALGISE